jgi:hypothetical protein
MVDVLMSIDIVKKSYSKDIKHIILIAGDSDFVPAIKTAKDQDIIVHLFYQVLYKKHKNYIFYNILWKKSLKYYLVQEKYIMKC